MAYNNRTAWKFTWEKGRELSSASADGKNITFTHDVDGIRESKTINGVKHEYVTLDGLIYQEKWGNVIVSTGTDSGIGAVNPIDSDGAFAIEISMTVGAFLITGLSYMGYLLMRKLVKSFVSLANSFIRICGITIKNALKELEKDIAKSLDKAKKELKRKKLKDTISYIERLMQPRWLGKFGLKKLDSVSITVEIW